MLGTIIGIEENNVLVDVKSDLGKIGNIINLHVVFEDSKNKIVGEIVDIKDNIAYVNLLGQIGERGFVYGVICKPSFGAKVKFIPEDYIPSIISISKFKENKHLYLGMSAMYNDVEISVDVNDFFSNHFAIFGSTGSGKSCSVARIFQNLFEKKTSIPYRANIFIFDAYGEYHNAFKDLGKKVPEIGFKAYTTNLKAKDVDILKLPLWLMSLDDIALLLGADRHSQMPIIEKAMKLVTVFAQEEKLVIKHKNDIIARALLDILASGKASSQIRDQIFSVLTYYNTKDLNLESPIYQPGYTRPLKQCLLIDATGKIREMELLTEYISGFLAEGLELNMPDGSFMYTLDDLQAAFEFALISEGVLKSDKIYDDANVLKVRLHSLVSSGYSEYFNYPEYVTKKEYIHGLLALDGKRKAQLINFNINYVDDRFAKVLTKIYSKLLFDYSKDIGERGSLPFHIVLEEAHRYVQKDNDVFLLGYNIFERITKEGRKYGVLLGLISQRPSELSETTLSQCSNFLIFKMLHPVDIEYIKEMVPNITSETVKRLKILQPGTCIAFGNAFKVPVIIKMELPDPTPSSDSCDISRIWFVDKK